jgi:hypothetical protein
VTTELRHRCRNQRCRSKLPEPVENPHRAFCCRGCFEQFYRTRCLVCETRKHHQRRQLCGHVNCKREKNRFPHVFQWGVAATVESIADVPVLSPLKWLSRCLQGFAWGETDCDTWTLHHRDGTARAVVRRAEDGDHWWVARPRAYSEPPAEPLAQAKRRAEHMALVAMPSPLPDPNPRLVAQVRRERELYPWRFSDAGERYARGVQIFASQWEPATPQHRAEMPDIPDFLRRAREHESVH